MTLLENTLIAGQAQEIREDRPFLPSLGSPMITHPGEKDLVLNLGVQDTDNNTPVE